MHFFIILYITRKSNFSVGFAYKYLRSLGLSRPEAFISSHWIYKESRDYHIFKNRLHDRGKLRKPLEYILGTTDFYKMKDFIVQEPNLVPRPETERMVDLIVSSRKSEPRVFVDLCCGTGNIAVALLRAWPNSFCIAVDISEQAIENTRINAEKFNVSERLKLFHGSIDDFGKCFKAFDMAPELIVSNPPYIPSANICHLQPEILRWESHCALDGGQDGMHCIREIIKVFKKTSEIWLEVDAESDQCDKIQAEVVGRFQSFVEKDWRGCNRFIRLFSVT